MIDTIQKDRLDDYLSKTRKALESLEIAPEYESYLYTLAEDFLTMAKAYFDDASLFAEEGDLVSAFACVNYAHGWLDCGARTGLFKVWGNDSLFTLYR